MEALSGGLPEGLALPILPRETTGRSIGPDQSTWTAQ